MNTQELKRKQIRLAKLARRCGVLGFVSDDLTERWELTRLAELPENDLDKFEDYLKDFEALLESLRSPN